MMRLSLEPIGLRRIRQPSRARQNVRSEPHHTRARNSLSKGRSRSKVEASRRLSHTIIAGRDMILASAVGGREHTSIAVRLIMWCEIACRVQKQNPGVKTSQQVARPPIQAHP
eukprot:TRINITY_DN17610_c6_g1_i1.p1 TRINITY_DN17610_c6_g1~~TRINITY_DN17610_c6_g1_i1.p1  ORF type:complete len:113 (-),score=15.28 TRINITY_DN17610_c6_g1_i1:22-360(-)